MPFERIKRILPRSIKSAGINKQVQAIQVIQAAEETLRRLWGVEKASHLSFVSFSEGRLKIHTSSPSALQEFKIGRIQIQNEVNRALGTKAIHEILC